MYRVIKAGSNISPIEKEYNRLCRESAERNFEYDMASKVGHPISISDEYMDYEQKLQTRIETLHDKLFDMWSQDPNSVSPQLCESFEEEVEIGQMLPPFE